MIACIQYLAIQCSQTPWEHLVSDHFLARKVFKIAVAVGWHKHKQYFKSINLFYMQYTVSDIIFLCAIDAGKYYAGIMLYITAGSHWMKHLIPLSFANVISMNFIICRRHNLEEPTIINRAL